MDLEVKGQELLEEKVVGKINHMELDAAKVVG